MAGPAIDPNALDIVYDGQCPFCSSYTSMVALRAAGRAVRLHDARDRALAIRFPEIRQYDLNAGMLVRWQDNWYHGAAAMQLISTLSERAPLGWLMRHRRVAKVMYPILRFGRAIVLRLRGVAPIE